MSLTERKRGEQREREKERERGKSIATVGVRRHTLSPFDPSASSAPYPHTILALRCRIAVSQRPRPVRPQPAPGKRAAREGDGGSRALVLSPPPTPAWKDRRSSAGPRRATQRGFVTRTAVFSAAAEGERESAAEREAERAREQDTGGNAAHSVIIFFSHTPMVGFLSAPSPSPSPRRCFSVSRCVCICRLLLHVCAPPLKTLCPQRQRKASKCGLFSVCTVAFLSFLLFRVSSAVVTADYTMTTVVQF